jgi:hypothetical protein
MDGAMLILRRLRDSLFPAPAPQAIEAPPTAAVGSGPQQGEPTAGPHTPQKPKKSSERGEARRKIIAALNKHHQYDDGSCLSYAPISNNELARQADVAPSTASAFFMGQFQGHDKYRALCRKKGDLATALKLLNGEFSPHILFGHTPPGEGPARDK